MSSLVSWVGSGAGLVAVGLAVLVGKYHEHAPRKSHPWFARSIIVMMLGGGSVIAVTILGGWAIGAMQWLAVNAGGWGSAISILTACGLIAAVIVGLLVGERRVATAALMLPLVLGMFHSGFLHDLDHTVSPKTRQGVAQATNWLGKVGSK